MKDCKPCNLHVGIPPTFHKPCKKCKPCNFHNPSCKNRKQALQLPSSTCKTASKPCNFLKPLQQTFAVAAKHSNFCKPLRLLQTFATSANLCSKQTSATNLCIAANTLRQTFATSQALRLLQTFAANHRGLVPVSQPLNPCVRPRFLKEEHA